MRLHYFCQTPNLPEDAQRLNAVPDGAEIIELTDVTTANSDTEKDIIKIINIYEEKYKVLAALNPNKCEGEDIFREIRNTLLADLNIELKTLYENDYASFSMILAAFYSRKHALHNIESPNDEIDYLPECHHPLHTVMVMCYAAHSMQKKMLKHDFGQAWKQEKYAQLKEQLEEFACKIINNLYLSGQDGPERVLEALSADYKSEFESTNCNEESMREIQEKNEGSYSWYLNRKFNKSKEILAIAYKAKAMKFLSQRPCLNMMKMRRECRKVVDNRINQKFSIKKHLTKWKLLIHGIFRGFYIVMFAYMLCSMPNYDGHESGDDRGGNLLSPSTYVLLTLIAQVSMTFIKLIDYWNFYEQECSFWLKLERYFHLNKLAFWRLLLVVPLLALEYVKLLVFARPRQPEKSVRDFWSGFWTLIPIASELLYCTLFAIATISSLRFFHFIHSLGFFMHIFQKMWKTVGMFFFIFCTFWFVLAVIHVSISRAFISSNNSILYTVTSPGKFEIFGEVQDDDRLGNFTDCAGFNGTIFQFLEMNYAEASCLVRTTIMPFLVFSYIFVMGILLINLLTAQLTKEYENESEKSRYYKGYLKYEQLSKLESKLYLPPPLSLFYVVIRVVFIFPLLLHKCCSSILPFVWTEIIEQMEGRPWKVVEGTTKTYTADDKIKEFMTKRPDNIWEQFKDVVNNYERQTADEENMRQMKEEIDKIFRILIEEERSRSRITPRERNAPTLSSYDDNPAEEMDV